MPRLEVAIISRDGEATIVNAARPASLVAFSDAHEGKVMPETVREVAFVVHHALGIEQSLDEWLATLEDISAMPEDVALAKRILAGDDEARQMALGELARPAAAEEAEPPHPTDPALEQLAGDEQPEPEPEPEPELEQASATAGGSSSRA